MLVEPASGAVVVAASRPVDVSFPAHGLVEQDANQLWGATLAAAEECLARRPEAALAGVSISNQRESVVCWERSSGRPLGPVLGWQDARTAAWCADLAERHPHAAALVRSSTGLSLDPMFSAPKMRHALDAATAAGAALSDVAVGTVDAWLVWRLTGELAIEAGNASRTLLLDLQTLQWDPELLDLFGVPSASCRRSVRPTPASAARGTGSRPGRHPRRRGTGRLPRGPVLPRLHGSRDGQGDLRHRVLGHDSRRRPRPRAGRDRHDPGLAGRRDADVRAGGQHPGERFGSGLDCGDVGLVRRGPRRRVPLRPGRTGLLRRRRVPGPCVHGAGRAVLGPLGERDPDGADRRYDACARRQGRARGGRPPGRRRRRGRRVRW